MSVTRLSNPRRVSAASISAAGGTYGIHPEATDWRTRVIANGGTVSDSTFTAVNTFCLAIASAGIRDRFLRLNLFCGNQLAACLVPLYRGQSFGGTNVGNTTDTNVGPFVSGDYTETGTSGGLSQTGSKALRTGITGNSVPIAFDGHLLTSIGTTGTFVLTNFTIGTRPGSGNFNSFIYSQTNYVEPAIADGNQANTLVNTTTNVHFGRLLATRTSSTNMVLYKNGSSLQTRTNAASSFSASAAGEVSVFAADTGVAAATARYLMQSYSVGLGMTASQVSAYDAALVTFFTALGRL